MKIRQKMLQRQLRMLSPQKQQKPQSLQKQLRKLKPQSLQMQLRKQRLLRKSSSLRIWML